MSRKMNKPSKITDCLEGDRDNRLSKARLLAIMLISSCLLTSCATYKDKFNCQDSRGADCTMLSQVDRIIDSGEIEEIYDDKECRGKSCKSRKRKSASNNNIPRLKQDEQDSGVNTNYYSGK